MPPALRTALACLVAAAFAAPPAVAAPRANVVHTATDAAFVVATDPRDPRVSILATAMRTTATGTTGVRDTLVVCLTYRAGRVREAGCTTTAGRPVTAGTGQPESATIRARVPVQGRRGGWIEADLRLTAVGLPWTPPAVCDYWLRATGASVGAGPAVMRSATLTGTLRTDRGVRVSPVSVEETWLPTSLARIQTVAAGADV
ncbi:MAG TPA: hypothetical protein VGX28_13655 [Frankiaceae bacterium]|jgi:hypothetical protein|nr:hypothetical protein [Frankiaceae bacterium]